MCRGDHHGASNSTPTRHGSAGVCFARRRRAACATKIFLSMHLVLLVLLASAPAAHGGGEDDSAPSANGDQLAGTASVITFVGTAPKGFRSGNWLGNYSVYTGKLVERKVDGLLSGRHVFAMQKSDGTQDASKLMWYRKHEGRWYVGRSRALDKAAGVLFVADTAVAPEQITGQWQAWLGDKRGWESTDLRILSQAQAHAIIESEERSKREAVASATVISLVGQPPDDLRHEWLGEYHRSGLNDSLAGGRPRYRKMGDEAKSLWFDGGTWFFGSSALVGKHKGVIHANDLAVVPSAVKQGAWRVASGKGKESRLATGLRCLQGAEAAEDARRAHARLQQSAKTVYLVDSHLIDGDRVKPAGNAPDWQGPYAFKMPSGSQGRGKYVKYDPGSGLQWVLWYQERSGLWLLGRYKRGKKSPKVFFTTYDGAQLPNEITSPWQPKKAQPGALADVGIRCFVGAEGAALLKAQSVALADLLSKSADSIALVGLRPGALHEWEGNYTLRRSSLHNERRSFVHMHDRTKALWYDKRSHSWLVGRINVNYTEERFPHPNTATLRVADTALMPDRINGTWQASFHGAWTDLRALHSIAGSDLEIAHGMQTRELERSSRTVYFAGAVQPSLLSLVMGTYDVVPNVGSEPWTRRRYRRRATPEEPHKPSDTAILELRYDVSSGEWRLDQRLGAANDSENTTTLLYAYDGALAPELITSQWRSTRNGHRKRPDEAADVVCRAGKEGLLAIEADRAVITLRRATLPGWPSWLFPVRLTPLMAAVASALRAGVSPMRVRATLFAAQTTGLSAELVRKALFKVPRGGVKRAVQHKRSQRTKAKAKAMVKAKKERKRSRHAVREQDEGCVDGRRYGHGCRDTER